MKLLPALFWSAAGGVLWALQFGREPWLLAPWLALAPLVLLLGSKRPGWLGFVHGFVSWSIALSWIPATLQTFGGSIAPPLAWLLVSLLNAYLALYHAAFAALGARLWRQGRAGAVLFGLPALWVALEWLRTYLGGGFPWNLAAYSWVDVPGALPLAGWIGAYGISFLAVATASGVALWIAQRGWKPLAFAWLSVLLLLPLAGRWSGWNRGGIAGEPWGDAIPVRILQPNVPNLVEFEPVQVLANYRKVFQMSEEACQDGALVIWPESAAWPFSYDRDEQFARDLQTLSARGCALVFNSTHTAGAGKGIYNSAYLMAPGAALARYDKRHLVPFGEYVPFSGVFSFVDKLAREAGDFRAGTSVRLLPVGPTGKERLGMSICYEVVFPDEVADLTRAGATILVTITNDAWYGDTAAPWQHFRAARFRAAENRRPVLRAAITGVSALIAPDGSVTGQIDPFRQGVIRGWVEGRRERSPYTRCPWLVPALCTLGAALTLIRRKRSEQE